MTRHSIKDDRAERTRKSILRSAMQEFSAHGLSGARTDRIAASAGVNKALLYYYFKSKQGLYAASVEAVATRVVENALAEFDPKYSAGERLLRSALNHFDRILTQRDFQSLIQQEMVRVRSSNAGSTRNLFRTAFVPLLKKMREAAEEGMRTRELCQMDWLQAIYSILGANVFYFLSAPMMEVALPFGAFEPKALAARRKSAAQFLGMALFTDRAAGLRLANRVLRDMPTPPVKRLRDPLELLPARRKTL